MTSEKQELEGVAEKFKGMEDRMKSLLQLSEVLSVRYNPFLAQEEGDVFDGSRHDPASLLPKADKRFQGEVVPVDADAEPERPARAAPGPDARPREAGAQEPDEAWESEASEAREAPEEPEPEEDPGEAAYASYSREHELDAELEAALAPFHEPPAPKAEPEPEDEPAPAETPAPVPEAEPEAAPPRAPPSRPAPRSVSHAPRPPTTPPRAGPGEPGPSPHYAPPGRSRESYIALCWFERLAREGDPSEIHLFVDHYAGLGWIPPEHHGWMSYLAEAVAPRRDDQTWDDVDMPAHELARLHRRNLRFLDRLFRCGLGQDDPLRWDDEAQWWMEDA